MTMPASAPSVAAPAPSASAPSSASTPSTSNVPSSAPGTSQKTAPQSSAPSSGGGDPGAKHIGGEQQPQEDAQGRLPGETAAEAQARKFKLKVNGREMEMDEQEVIRRAQLASAADQKFQEAAQIRKQAEQFFNTLLEDPMSILTHPELAEKIKFRELAENYLAKELQRELLSPEQRELEELRQWKQQQEETAQKQQQEQMTKAQKEEMQRLQQRAAQEYDQKITDVLAQSDLPKTPYTVKRVAELLYNALQKGYDLDVQTAVDMVREGYMGDIQALVGGLDGDALIKALGPDLIKKLRKYDLAQLKARNQPAQADNQPRQNSTQPKQSKQEQQQFMRPEQWLEHLRKKAGV